MRFNSTAKTCSVLSKENSLQPKLVQTKKLLVKSCSFWDQEFQIQQGQQFCYRKPFWQNNKNIIVLDDCIRFLEAVSMQKCLQICNDGYQTHHEFVIINCKMCLHPDFEFLFDVSEKNLSRQQYFMICSIASNFENDTEVNFVSEVNFVANIQMRTLKVKVENGSL
eukprot:TRINITY_DN9212_c0_g1_i1.p1 TRINITY_DN9212_c0_g1~~TRINITY_DN9212_c0_g1_i1.p1  ORF type:complete len:166 (-),score=16.01 TRINITY_DN9212_c0_g1_i1:56-553(-)